MPSTVKNIYSHAFDGAFSSEIVLNDGLESIGDYAFEITAFRTISIPDTLNTIGSPADYLSSVATVDMPSSVTKIGDYAFYSDKLANAIINADSVVISNYSFKKNTTLFGNSGSTAETFASSNGNKFVAFTTSCSDHSYVIDEYVVEPTCQSKGKATTYCGACGQAGPETTVAKLDHNKNYAGVCTMCQTPEIVNGEIKLNSSTSGTITSDGGAYFYCKVAKDGKYTLSIDKLSQPAYWMAAGVHSNGAC